MSVRRIAYALGLYCVIGLQSTFAAGADAGVDVLLEQADSARSSDPGSLDRRLAALNADPRVQTTPQRERLHYLNAYALIIKGRYDEGIVSLRKLLETSSDPDIRVRAGALIANTYTVTRDFTAGLRQLAQTMAMVGEVRNPDYREQVFGVAAVMQNQIGQYRLAREYAERVLAMTTSNRARCFAGQSRLEAMQKLGALKNHKEAQAVIDLCVAGKELIVANLARADLARELAESGDRKGAIELLRRYLDEVRATGYPNLIAEFEAQLAELSLAANRLEEADLHAREAVAQSASVPFAKTLVSARHTLYRLAEIRGDMGAAYRQYREFAEADKAYLDEIKAREMAYQTVRLETVQKSQQIELLDRQNQVLQLQQKVNRQKSQTSSLLILLLLVLLGSIGYWAYKVKRMQRSLRRMAEVDALTSVCSRRHFSQQSELALQQCARAGEDAALIMFDLDHFKSINDRFGHETGDYVLCRVTEKCKTYCRRVDHLGRLGGEEFAILLPGCDIRSATRLAEDCRVGIATLDSQSSGHKFLITASFGVTATKASGYDLAKLLSHADMVLYRAKREGRNRVCTFDGEMLPWAPGPVAPETAPELKANAPAAA